MKIGDGVEWTNGAIGLKGVVIEEIRVDTPPPYDVILKMHCGASQFPDGVPHDFCEYPKNLKMIATLEATNEGTER
jgi:hypothetical protein